MIKLLMDHGVTVVCAGGGGIPVVDRGLRPPARRRGGGGQGPDRGTAGPGRRCRRPAAADRRGGRGGRVRDPAGPAHPPDHYRRAPRPVVPGRVDGPKGRSGVPFRGENSQAWRRSAGSRTPAPCWTEPPARSSAHPGREENDERISKRGTPAHCGRGRRLGGLTGRAALGRAPGRVHRATLEAVIGWQYPAFYGWAPAVPDDADYGQIAEQVLTETLDKVLGPDRPAWLVTRVVAVIRPRPWSRRRRGLSCWWWATAGTAGSPMLCSARSAPTASITRTARSRSSGPPGTGTASADR